VRLAAVDREISIGDYVLTGGEIPALVIIDAVSRYIPGLLGCADSVEDDSFAEGLLEYPQYTRPPVFRDMAVPEVLLSGNHAQIERWRRQESLRRTLMRRPDLLDRAGLSEDDLEILAELKAQMENKGM
jgi:tRNA (guanine37-N1)-methyltransferase